MSDEGEGKLAGLVGFMNKEKAKLKLTVRSLSETKTASPHSMHALCPANSMLAALIALPFRLCTNRVACRAPYLVLA